jgi:hypothetical protein
MPKDNDECVTILRIPRGSVVIVESLELLPTSAMVQFQKNWEAATGTKAVVLDRRFRVRSIIEPGPDHA